MAIRIQPYTADDIEKVRAFNERLKAGGAPSEFRFPENPVPRWLPRRDGSDTYNEFYLALDEAAVRGTYALKHQPFVVNGEVRSVAFYHHPFSEGIINRSFSAVGAMVLHDALKRQPLTYCLGMGGYDRPLPRMLMALKWSHFPAPFFFRIVRPFRFLTEMKGLRQDARRRTLMDVAAWTGAGWAGIHAFQTWNRRASLGARAVRHEPVPRFDSFADEVWTTARHAYRLIAVRNAAALNVLYPEDNPRFMRLKITAGGAPVGWAVVADTCSPGHAQYGDLRVGHILDAMASPGDAVRVAGAAYRALVDRGVDLVVVNHTHEAWLTAYRRLGFLSGPSNFIFAVPPAFARMLEPFDAAQREIFFTRGDGDGLYQFQATGKEAAGAA